MFKQGWSGFPTAGCAPWESQLQGSALPEKPRVRRLGTLPVRGPGLLFAVYLTGLSSSIWDHSALC